LYVSSKDIGIDSILASLHEGDVSTDLCVLLKYEAHQKHDLHIKKFLSLEIVCCLKDGLIFAMTFIVSIFLRRNVLQFKIPEYSAIR